MNKKLVATIAISTSFRAIYSCDGGYNSTVFVDSNEFISQQALWSRRARAAAQLQVDQLTDHQRAQLLEKAGSEETLHDALRGFTSFPRLRDVLTQLSSDAVLDYAERYYTSCFARSRKVRNARDLRSFGVSGEPRLAGARARRAEVRAMTDKEIQALADEHDLPFEMMRIARHDYARNSRGARALIDATRTEIEAAAMRHAITKQQDRKRFQEGRDAMGAVTDEQIKALADEHQVSSETMHAARQRYKKRAQAVQAFMTATKQEIEDAAERYRLAKLKEAKRTADRKAQHAEQKGAVDALMQIAALVRSAIT